MYVVLVAFEGGEEVWEPVVSMARDWLNAWDVMFWILENERFCVQDAFLEPVEVVMRDEIVRARWARREK